MAGRAGILYTLSLPWLPGRARKVVWAGMGFLDRFKPQPKWKHPDRAVRLSAVESLPDTEQAVLESIATEDEDAGVRRAAVARLTNVARLTQIARDDADEAVRLEARELLLAFARDSSSESDARDALAGLTEPRDLAIVARTAEIEAVALAALERLEDPRLVGVVARQATHGAVRRAALARLAAEEELVAVATKSEHRDVGLEAIERLERREAIEAVAVRARQKAVARRARARLRALDEQARVAEAERAAAARRVALCEGLEQLAQSADFSRAVEQLAAARGEWQILGPGADPVVAERFEAAVARIEDLLQRNEAERAEEQRRAAALAAEIAQAAATRQALCERVEALDGDAAAAGLDEARTIWVALMPWPEPARGSAQARQLEERFERACAECERRIARHAELAAERAALDELLVKAEEAAVMPDLAAARTAWGAVRQAWAARAPGVADRVRAERFAQVEARMQAREGEAREARAREAREHLARTAALCEQLEQLAARGDLALKDLERPMREARAVLDHPGHFPTRQDLERTLDRLRKAMAALQPRLKELREVDDWQRWANANQQEELCVKAEALGSVSDPVELSKQIRDLQQQWRKIGPGPREKSEELWRRFKAACDAAWARCSDHLARQREQEAENLRRKESICLQAEALAESTDWIRTSEELKRLQAEWQSIGPVPREQARVLWERFHGACDRFFTRRKADLAERKAIWAENQRKKEAICARAEAIAESTDWAAAIAEIKQLQAEWKTVGPVKRQKAEALWLRFRAACDKLFDRYKRRDEIEAAAVAQSREALCLELERLAPPETDGPAASSPSGAGEQAEREGGDAEAARVAPDAIAAPDAAAAPDAPATDTAGSAPQPAAPGAAPALSVPQLVEQVLGVWRRWQEPVRLPRTLAEPLEARFDRALARILSADPARFKGTPLDVEANRQRMEQLCRQVESYVAGKLSPRELAAAPAATLATMLKDALAANTIGGRVDDEARWRAAAAAVREAQAAWRRLGPVPGEVGRQLDQRFRRACRRFQELRQTQGARPTPA
jgi:hypothetical protein